MGRNNRAGMYQPWALGNIIPKKRVSLGEAYAHTAMCSGKMTNRTGKLLKMSEGLGRGSDLKERAMSSPSGIVDC